MAVENNMDDELDQVSAEAMQIIMSAGDARVSCNDALKAIAEGSVETAKELIKKAEGQIAEAHHVQTDAIQGSTVPKSSSPFRARCRAPGIWSSSHLTLVAEK